MAIDPMEERVRRTVYVPRHVQARVQLLADEEGRSWNNALCAFLDAGLPPLIGEERRRLSRRVAPEPGPPVAAIPTRCPRCGDDVFFRTVAPNRWACDACDKEGTY